MKHITLVPLALLAIACAPEKLTARTHIVAPNKEIAQYYQDAIDQVQHLIPYLITTDTQPSTAPNVWTVYLAPCGTDVGENVLCKNNQALAVTNYNLQRTWFADSLSSEALAERAAHEFGHKIGLVPIQEAHPEHGVMRSDPEGPIFTEVELQQIADLYAEDWNP